jgi:hypothetical protein
VKDDTQKCESRISKSTAANSQFAIP